MMAGPSVKREKYDTSSSDEVDEVDDGEEMEEDVEVEEDVQIEEEEVPAQASDESDKDEEKAISRRKCEEEMRQLIRDHEKYESYLKKATAPDFTERERKIMIMYLIVHNGIYQSKGLQIWRQMLKEKILTHRTPHSLCNHLRQFIMPNLEKMKIPAPFKDDFRRMNVVKARRPRIPKAKKPRKLKH